MMSKYLQVAYEIKQLIKTGIYPADYRLSERKLAKEYNTSRATISNALQILKDEGYIISVPQSGSIVADSNIEKSIWAPFIDKSMGLTSDNRHKAAIKYLSENKKINSTFGFHKSFEPYKPLKQALASLIKNDKFDEYMNEYDIKGLYSLRKNIANHLKRYNINVSEENLVIFNGYIEALYTITIALLSYNTNFYYMKNDMIKNMYIFQYAKLNMFEIDYDINGIKVLCLKNILKPGRNILYINPIHNYPTGIIFSEQKMKNIANVCQEYQIPIIENDFLRDINCDTQQIPPPYENNYSK